MGQACSDNKCSMERQDQEMLPKQDSEHLPDKTRTNRNTRTRSTATPGHVAPVPGTCFPSPSWLHQRRFMEIASSGTLSSESSFSVEREIINGLQDWDLLICSASIPTMQTDRQTDRQTERQGMHACRPAHKGNNILPYMTSKDIYIYTHMRA